MVSVIRDFLTNSYFSNRPSQDEIVRRKPTICNSMRERGISFLVFYECSGTIARDPRQSRMQFLGFENERNVSGTGTSH